MYPNRVAAVAAAVIALALAVLPVIGNFDWTSTAGALAGIVAVLAIVQKWLDGWQKHEARHPVARPAWSRTTRMPKRHEISRHGLEFIAGFEGFVNHPYQDSGGVWTIGYGHTGPGTASMGTITRERGLELLRRDIHIAADAVNEFVRVGLSQARFDALVSFVFNVGVGAFRGSSLLRKLNAGEYGAVPGELMRWNKVNGQPLAGLTRRREAEGKLFARSRWR